MSVILTVLRVCSDEQFTIGLNVSFQEFMHV